MDNCAHIQAEVVRLKDQHLKPIPEQSLPRTVESLEGVVYSYNFDTFSYIFELLNVAELLGTDLAKAFEQLQIDSLAMIETYGGGNCAGLSLKLQAILQEQDIETVIAPSYGNYLATEQADKYAEIRTVDLLGVTLAGKDTVWLFLAPGLTVDKPIYIIEGFTVNTKEKSFEVFGVDRDGFSLRTTSLKGIIERRFECELLVNPNHSSQKNLLRARTSYQITRTYKDKDRDRITYDFIRGTYKVEIEGQTSTMNPAQFKIFLDREDTNLDQIFVSRNLRANLTRFNQNIGKISQSILLPSIQKLIRES